MIALAVASLAVTAAARLIAADLAVWETAALRAEAALLGRDLLEQADLGLLGAETRGVSADGRFRWEVRRAPGPLPESVQLSLRLQWTRDPGRPPAGELTLRRLRIAD